MKNYIDEIAFPHLVIEREIKANDRSRVCLVRKKEAGERYIYRSFTGSGEVYHKLLGIDCPYLPKIHDIKEENGTVYVLEEYIQGDTLAFLLEYKPLSQEYAEQIIRQICQGLKVLHGIGAVHRDIKPENIILRGSDAVLIDFDASRLCKAENTTDTQIMGTTGYAAPEQYGFSQTDARTDIYALGILLNEMLTKQHPSKQLAEGKFRPIIEKCTRINADQRYASVTELTAALNPPRKRRIRHCLILLLVFAILLGSWLLYRTSAPHAAEETMRTEETNPPSTTEETTQADETNSLPLLDVFERKQVEITMDPWEGSIETYGTPFKCDMDNNGEVESYLFGADFINSPHENIFYYDQTGSRPGYQHVREVHPCVWRVSKDGTMEVATEFAALLTDAEVKIWRVDDFVSPQPEAWTKDYIWPGCVRIIFSPKQTGTWLYEVSATLSGQELNAVAISVFDFS